jgi:hypothetical protein
MMLPESTMKKHQRRRGPVQEPSNNPSRASSQSSQQLQIPSLVMNSCMMLVSFSFIQVFFLSLTLSQSNYPIYCLLQITKHWSNNEKPEMTLEKLQLVATTVAAPPHKVRWLQNWNSSSLSREALHFLQRDLLTRSLKLG